MDNNISLYIVSALIPIIVICVANYQARKNKKSHLNVEVSKEQMKKLFAAVMRRLNCAAEYQADGSNENRILASAMYQGVPFVFTIPNDPWLKIDCLNVMKVDMAQANAARLACNDTNAQVYGVNVCYTVEDDGKMHIHVSGNNRLGFNDDENVDTTQVALNTIFFAKRKFEQNFNEALARNRGIEDEDKKQKICDIRQLVNYHESLGYNSDRPVLSIDNDSDSLSLHQLLHSFGFVDEQMVFSRMTIIRGEEQKQMSGHDEASNYNLKQLLQGDASTTILLTLVACGSVDTERECMVRIVPVTELSEECAADKGVAFFRITACLEAAEVSSEFPLGSQQQMARAESVIVGSCYESPTRMASEYKYMYGDASDKVKSGDRDSLTREQRYLLDVTSVNDGYLLYWGSKRFHQHRFAEAIRYLLPVYADLVKNRLTYGDDVQEAYDTVCYMLGSSYLEFENYQQACYYLEQLKDAPIPEYREEFINCLVNHGDHRAWIYVNQQCDMLSEKIDEEEDKDVIPESVISYYEFLSRRKAYMLIERGDFDSAEELLTKLLKIPSCADFAKNELEYVKQLKQQKQDSHSDEK